MKRFGTIYLLMLLSIGIIFTAVNLGLRADRANTEKSRNVIVNRLTYSMQQSFYVEPNMDEVIKKEYYDRLSELGREYRKHEIPDAVFFVSVDSENQDLRLAEANDKRMQVIRNADGSNAGFLVFIYELSVYDNAILYVNGGIAVAALLLFAFVIFIQIKVIVPFSRMSAYPEKLSKGEINSKLPESKNRYFGKFVWGINMLSDKLSGDKKRINKLMKERQVMLTTIAHGIKTPVANIKLYASAIETGLYQEDGVPDEKDALVAAKIDQNADEITALVKEMIETTATGMVDFQPNIGKFYVSEIREYIEKEYSNRFKALRIPYTVNCMTEALIESDKAGIIRILAQIMDNAVKYGDGSGIDITIEKQEEGFFFSVKNKGELISERELPYVFNSFWRGSNAEQIEGSGIGMFEAKRIARMLGGDIYAKRYEDSREMEFVLFIEN